MQRGWQSGENQVKVAAEDRMYVIGVIIVLVHRGWGTDVADVTELWDMYSGEALQKPRKERNRIS